MSEISEDVREIQLLKVATWGQAIGFTAVNAFLMYEDAPRILERANLLLPTLLILGAISLSIPKVSKFLAASLSGFFLIGIVLIISFSTLLAAIAVASLAFSIPDALVTEGWQYTRTTSVVALAIFLIAFIANIVSSFQLLRTRRAKQATAK